MKPVSIIPAPRRVTPGKEPLLSFSRLFPEADAAAEGELRVFREQLPELFESPSLPEALQLRIELSPGGDANNKETYSLSLSPTGIMVRSPGTKGLYHGLQSLRQLLLAGREEGGRWTLPCLEIDDGPRFSWRGFMLDCSRHYYSLSFIKKAIDAASLHHLNVFHWHLTDDQGWRLPVKGYPLLTEIGAFRQDSKTTWQDLTVGGFYTHEEIREVVRYAAERHVEVVPEVDLPGHASAILAAYPNLGCTGGPYRVEDRYGIFEDVLCAGNDDIFPFFAAVFDTLSELFPSKYVHIGGDEVKFNRWKECPKCRSRLAELKLGETHRLQSWITVRLANMLEDRGKTPIGWDEVLEGTEVLGLPKDMIVMSWRGQEGGIEASRRGHRVIMTPLTEGCYLNFKHLDSPEEPGHLETATVAKSYAMDPAAPGISSGEEALILGGQCNLWSEVIYASRIAEYMLFPRMGAIAEGLWSPREIRSLESFKERLPAYGKVLDALDLTHYRGPLQ